MSVPRVITVDPTGSVARILHAVLDLSGRTVLQVNVPDAASALREMAAGCSLMLMAFRIDGATRGFELAARVYKQSPETAVIVLGESGDPDEFDEETLRESPYVYLRRPVDPQKFLRVINAGLDGGSLKSALSVPPAGAAASVPGAALGSVPVVDLAAAQSIIDRLLIDIGAMALILATRAGEVLIERGAVGYVNREKLASALTPALLTSIDVKDLVGGQLYTLQFYDGDQYDLFVMSVGLHHFLCAVFDGQSGSRQFGVVNRFGRRAVEDIVALIGVGAFTIDKTAAPRPAAEPPRRTRPIPRLRETGEELQALQRSILGEDAPPPAPAPLPEPAVAAEPIAAGVDELAALFSGDFKADGADDLFDLDSLEEMVNKNMQNQKGKLGWDEAKKIGLF